MKSLFDVFKNFLDNWPERIINLNIPCPYGCNPENWQNAIEAVGDYFERRGRIRASLCYPYVPEHKDSFYTACSCYELEMRILLKFLKEQGPTQTNLHVYESDKEL